MTVQQYQSDIINPSITAVTTHIEPIEKIPVTYEVFQKIKALASDKKLWENILTNLDRQIILSGELPDALTTSAPISSFVLSMLFAGEEKTKEAMRLIAFSKSEVITTTIDKKQIELLFYHFLSGNEVLSLNKKFKNGEYLSKKKIDSYQFSNIYKIESLVFQIKLQEMFDKKVVDRSIYNYNHKAIKTLESEIIKNSLKVSEDCSFIYFVAITEPRPSVTFKGTYDQIVETPPSFAHSFILEQFYSPKENKDLIRKHMSYRSPDSPENSYTLAEHYTSSNQIDRDQGCMDKIQRETYFKDLRDLYSYDEPTEFPKLKQSLLSCYNVKGGPTPPGVFRTDIELFTGSSFRYVTMKVDPKECLKNIDEITKKYGS